MATQQYYNASIRNLTYRLRKFKNEIPEHLGRIVAKNETLILDTVRYKQLFDLGINGKGVEIYSYKPYKPYTIKMKMRKNQPQFRVTLRDTGKFYSQFRLYVTKDGFFIDSDAAVTHDLVTKYGETIFRLTNQNFTLIVREHLRPEFVRLFKEELKK